MNKINEAIKIAKKNNLKIDVSRYPNCNVLTIEQPLFSGFGYAKLRVTKSHRTGDRLRSIGAYSFLPTTLKNTAWNCYIPNTKEVENYIKLYKLSGVSFLKRDIPEVRFRIDKETREIKELQR